MRSAISFMFLFPMTLNSRQSWQNMTNMMVSVKQLRKHHHNDDHDEFSKKTIWLGEFKKCLGPSLNNGSGVIGLAGFDLEEIKWIWTGDHYNRHHHHHHHYHHK